MIITETRIPEVLLFQPNIHGDDRGFFMETFRFSHFRDRGLEVEFVQDNHSRSRRNTLRGLHFSSKAPGQASQGPVWRGIRCCRRFKKELAYFWQMGWGLPVV